MKTRPSTRPLLLLAAATSLLAGCDEPRSQASPRSPASASPDEDPRNAVLKEKGYPGNRVTFAFELANDGQTPIMDFVFPRAPDLGMPGLATGECTVVDGVYPTRDADCSAGPGQCVIDSGAQPCRNFSDQARSMLEYFDMTTPLDMVEVGRCDAPGLDTPEECVVLLHSPANDTDSAGPFGWRPEKIMGNELNLIGGPKRCESAALGGATCLPMHEFDDPADCDFTSLGGSGNPPVTLNGCAAPTMCVSGQALTHDLDVDVYLAKPGNNRSWPWSGTPGGACQSDDDCDPAGGLFCNDALFGTPSDGNGFCAGCVTQCPVDANGVPTGLYSPVDTACFDRGTAASTFVHEFAHKLGFAHEFQRPDTAKYIDYIDECLTPFRVRPSSSVKENPDCTGSKKDTGCPCDPTDTNPCDSDLDACVPSEHTNSSYCIQMWPDSCIDSSNNVNGGVVGCPCDTGNACGHPANSCFVGVGKSNAVIGGTVSHCLQAESSEINAGSWDPRPADTHELHGPPQFGYELDDPGGSLGWRRDDGSMMGYSSEKGYSLIRECFAYAHGADVSTLTLDEFDTQFQDLRAVAIDYPAATATWEDLCTDEATRKSLGFILNPFNPWCAAEHDSGTPNACNPTTYRYSPTQSGGDSCLKGVLDATGQSGELRTIWSFRSPSNQGNALIKQRRGYFTNSADELQLDRSKLRRMYDEPVHDGLLLVDADGSATRLLELHVDRHYNNAEASSGDGDTLVTASVAGRTVGDLQTGSGNWREVVPFSLNADGRTDLLLFQSGAITARASVPLGTDGVSPGDDLFTDERGGLGSPSWDDGLSAASTYASTAQIIPGYFDDDEYGDLLVVQSPSAGGSKLLTHREGAYFGQGGSHGWQSRELSVDNDWVLTTPTVVVPGRFFPDSWTTDLLTLTRDSQGNLNLFFGFHRIEAVDAPVEGDAGPPSVDYPDEVRWRTPTTLFSTTNFGFDSTTTDWTEGVQDWTDAIPVHVGPSSQGIEDKDPINPQPEHTNDTDKYTDLLLYHSGTGYCRVFRTQMISSPPRPSLISHGSCSIPLGADQIVPLRMNPDGYTDLAVYFADDDRIRFYMGTEDGFIFAGDIRATPEGASSDGPYESIVPLYMAVERETDFRAGNQRAPGMCGDGWRQVGEACDGEDFQGLDCSDLTGGTPGDLPTCSHDCRTVDTGPC